MPFDQNNLPEWNAPGVEPPQSKKDNGWGTGEKPPSDWFNWFFNKTYNALKSLFTNAQHKEEKGQPNGYASLDKNAKVPTSQLPIATTTSPGAISASDKAKLDGIAPGAEPNQNAFSNVKVGTTTISADSKTDTLELVAGQNIVLTPDAANDKVTIDVTGVAQAGHTHAFSEITIKPTTVDGYGITDAVKTSDVVTSPSPNKILKLDANGKLPTSITGNADGNAATASKLQTARTISLSGDVTGSTSFDGSSNVSINATLANSGVTPGTYPKVTVDAKGRVTGGQALSPSDIPNLDWSKITSGKPTTLSGYGITDGVPNSRKINVGAGLTGGGNLSADRTLSVSFGGNGSATTVARSDHNHDGTYVKKTGDTMTGALTVPNLIAQINIPSSSPPSAWPAGFVAGVVYNNGYPAVYGTIFSYKGTSGNSVVQLLQAWPGNDGGEASLYIRSARDTGADVFGPWRKVWSENNDGAGSGLDADLLDGLHASQFLRSDTSGTLNGNLTLNGSLIRGNTTLSLNTAGWGKSNGEANIAGEIFAGTAAGDARFMFHSAAGKMNVYVDGEIYLNEGQYKAWHAGNDGAGSGLDADTVDGKQASDFVWKTEKGAPNGVATLGPDGKVPSEQLSSDAATKDELTHLNVNIIDMAVELEILKGATLNGVT
ncbi:hypothetical protein ABES20_14555, partial [Geobacillus stearothermophilus]